jgi:hypothetical protein
MHRDNRRVKMVTKEMQRPRRPVEKSQVEGLADSGAARPPNTPESAPTNGLMTVSDFLTTYRISRSEFYRQASAGRIRLRKLGTASRVACSDAEAWAQSLPVK